jgi:tight adherence protein B
MREGVVGLSEMFSGLTNRLSKLTMLFEQADSPIKADAFFGLSAGLATLAMVATWISQAPIPFYPVSTLGGGSLPLLWILWRRRGRFKKFAKQLPDAMELIARFAIGTQSGVRTACDCGRNARADRQGIRHGV